MPTFLNFRSFEKSGPDKDAAFSDLPFYIVGDATVAFNRWRSKFKELITAPMLREWQMQYLAKKTHNTPGVGYFIQFTPYIPNKKSHPWTVKNLKNLMGPRKMVKTYLLLSDDNQILDRAYVNKDRAFQKAKELIENGYKGNITLEQCKTCPDNQSEVGKVFYTPSSGTQMGTWICFGIEAI